MKWIMWVFLFLIGLPGYSQYFLGMSESEVVREARKSPVEQMNKIKMEKGLAIGWRNTEAKIQVVVFLEHDTSKVTSIAPFDSESLKMYVDMFNQKYTKNEKLQWVAYYPETTVFIDMQKSDEGYYYFMITKSN